MDNKELLKIAEKAKENAYVPYSKFHVGAALLTKSGKVFTGCNVECASYGGTNCAERTAIFKAVSEGEKEFEKIAITSDNAGETYPCGICRQVILEFGRDIKVVLGESEGEHREMSIQELIPHGFTGADLKK
ncbi:cytidine deaminase [Tepidibacter hydrothermalis]|uniref:Cytidine deaminase n=1 Tax=Tepidibacter hydrothermalis TaxID=3036126 RepID=A0ABY8EKB1_9FIRM|nr:cytidine deaminase [Tepidibacter hydrothermalis]WFD11610.1 cytidine deaminase [Tepidibacter hydrothermalis]